MKILIGRHNGIGDLVMAVPFIATYLEMGHDVTLACSANRHAWFTWLFPTLKVMERSLICSPYEDFHEEAEGYDVYLNLNKADIFDEVSARLGGSSVNQQLVYAFLALRKHLPLPSRGLSPSRYISCPMRRTGETILFSKSTHPSRSLSRSLVDQIRERRPDILIDPKPGSLVELCLLVARAGAVIGVDSGGVHLAEAFGTPWRVLHTTFDFNARHSLYEHGSAATSLQAAIPCSPCRRHGGCDDIVCTARFDIDAILAPL